MSNLNEKIVYYQFIYQCKKDFKKVGDTFESVDYREKIIKGTFKECCQKFKEFLNNNFNIIRVDCEAEGYNKDKKKLKNRKFFDMPEDMFSEYI
jgi:hypothetical protein